MVSPYHTPASFLMPFQRSRFINQRIRPWNGGFRKKLVVQTARHAGKSAASLAVLSLDVLQMIAETINIVAKLGTYGPTDRTHFVDQRVARQRTVMFITHDRHHLRSPAPHRAL